MVDIPIGPITLRQAKRASWLSDLNPALALGEVATRTELVTALQAAQATLDLGRGAPCTTPVDDHERRARDAVRVRSAVIASFLEDLEAATDHSNDLKGSN